MNKVVKLEISEPIAHKNRVVFLGGWSTASIGTWLITKKLADRYTSMAEVAATAYHRDNQGNQQKARNNVSALRRWLSDRGEFLLVKYGYMRKVTELKVCDPSNENDRQVASEQLARLEAICEITEAERRKWESMLYLSRPYVGATE